MEEEYLSWLQADTRNVWNDLVLGEVRYLDKLAADVRKSREHEKWFSDNGWQELVTAERQYRRRLMGHIKEQRTRVQEVKWQMKNKMNSQQ